MTQGHYAATKAAVITLTRVLAQEVGADGITVNAICPGIILTAMGKNNLGTDEAVRYWEQVAALKRLRHALVGLALFFASDQSAFVTGQSLNVCGGIYFPLSNAVSELRWRSRSPRKPGLAGRISRPRSRLSRTPSLRTSADTLSFPRSRLGSAR